EHVPAQLVPAERGSGAGLGERRGDRCVHGVGGQPGAGDGKADEQAGREGAEERAGAVTDDPAILCGRHHRPPFVVLDCQRPLSRHRTPPVTRPRTRSAASSAQVMTAPASAVTPATTGVSRSTTAEARTAPTPG